MHGSRSCGSDTAALSPAESATTRGQAAHAVHLKECAPKLRYVNDNLVLHVVSFAIGVGIGWFIRNTVS